MSSINAIGSSPNAPSSRRRRIGERVLTALRVLLAIQFAAGGLLKLGGAEPMVTLFADIGAGQWLRHVVGALELAGPSACSSRRSPAPPPPGSPP